MHFTLVDTARFGYATISDDEMDQPTTTHSLEDEFEADMVELAPCHAGIERRGLKRQAAFEPRGDEARERDAHERRQLLRCAGLQRMAAGVPRHICGRTVGCAADDPHQPQQQQQQQRQLQR